MDEDNRITWSVVPFGHYPYDYRDTQLPPSPRIDRYQRSEASLIRSIGCLAHRVTRSTLPDYTIDEIKQAGRVCSNIMTFDDYLHFFGRIFDEPTDATTLILHLNLLSADDTRHFIRLLPNLTEYEVIILSTVSSTGKVVILLILPAQSTIDTYCILPIQFDEMKEPLKTLNRFLSQAFGRTFSINRRLQVPMSFHPDPLFVALFLIANIERFGNYLETNQSALLRYQLWMLNDFIDLHDTYLGKLDIEQMSTYSHPFRTHREPHHQYNKIEKKGWFVIDVKGDGNCGYYALILGLQNVGNLEYFIDTRSVSPRVARRRWQEQVISLRQRLETGSNELLSQVFPVDSPNRALPYWVNLLGVFDAEQQNELSNSFLIPNNDDISLYFNDDFTENEDMHHYHMNPYWSALVIAYVFGVRVIVITRISSPKKDAENENDVDHSHGTKIFEFDNDFRSSIDTYVPVTEHGKLFRISDASFRAKPTIELLYITGFKSLDAGPDDNHFLFLRRVLCVKVPSDIPVSKTPLLTYIHEEEAQSLNATNEMEVDTDSPLDLQHEQFQAGNDEAKEAQDESTTPPPSAINPMEAEMEPPPEEVQGDIHVATSREGTSNMPLPLPNNDYFVPINESPTLNATSPSDVQHEQFQAGNDEAMEAQDESTTPPIADINPMEAEMEPPPEEAQGDSHVATSREGTSNMPLPLQNNDNFLPINESPTLNATNAMEIDTNPMEAVTEPASDDVQEATSSCESCDNVIYDASSQKYFTARFNNNLKRYLNKTEVADLSTVDPLLLEDAKNQPNVWVVPSTW
jgi:hypothetical protein